VARIGPVLKLRIPDIVRVRVTCHPCKPGKRSHAARPVIMAKHIIHVEQHKARRRHAPLSRRCAAIARGEAAPQSRKDAGNRILDNEPVAPKEGE
jgi:hypothetical protein